MHKSQHADLLEDFGRINLPAEEIHVASEHQPPNPEDEEHITPTEHAALGIERATKKEKEPAWRDLGLERILTEGPNSRQSKLTGNNWSNSRPIR